MLLDASELSLALNTQESHPPAHSALGIISLELGCAQGMTDPVVTRSVTSTQGPSPGLPCPG